jgi:two-component system phosphate regulon sensor histidine kinase PhoR
MFMNRTSWIVAGAALAIILLLFFQINWLQHSARLIEEQFDQKATLALNSAVDALKQQDDPDTRIELTCKKTISECDNSCVTTNIDEAQLYDALQTAMERYDIELDFQFNILNQRPNCYDAQDPVYCTSVAALTNDSKAVEVRFSGKEKYVVDRLGLMAGTSVVILLAVCGLFVLIAIRLIQQHRMNAVSIAFFNNMAHEFRTPLTNIQLASNMLQKRVADGKGQKFVNIIHNEGDRLLEQVERMLHVAKLERGNYQLEKEPIRLYELIEEVCTDMQMQIGARRGTLAVKKPTQPGILIEGDRLHLSNAIRNMVDNALKYCENAPEINIEIEQQDEKILVQFCDNGIGISEQECARIFDPYHRIHRGNIHQQKGFGLGLAYVKKIVELHKGAIRLESIKGKGSTFFIELPLKLAAS